MRCFGVIMEGVVLLKNSIIIIIIVKKKRRPFNEGLEHLDWYLRTEYQD
jgi:hypothetical protein